MLRLSRYSRFATNDADEYKEMARRFNREIGVMAADDPFHFAMNAAPMELLTVSAFEVSEGTSIVLTNTGYSLMRMDLGGIERRVDGLDQVITPGTGYLAIPERKAQIVFPYASGIGTATCLTITLSDSLIRSQAELLIGEPVTQPLEVFGTLDLGRDTLLGQLIDLLVDQLDGGVFEKYPLLAPRKQRTLVSTLIKRTENNYQPLLGRVHGGSARRHVALMEELVEANIKCPPAIEEMAHTLDISERTLYENCRKVRGMSPKQIVRKMRLHAVHRRLRQARLGDTVTAIAHEYSFISIDYLAEIYMEEFHGERPVDTLNRALRPLIVSMADQLKKPTEDSQHPVDDSFD